MIRIAIEGFYAQVVARLSEDPKALKHFAVDVDARREMWRAAIQTETWAVERLIDYGGSKPDTFKSFTRMVRRFKKCGLHWLNRR